MKKAIEFCLDLLKMNDFKKIIKYIDKQEQLENNPEEYIKNNFYSGHHLIGGLQNLVDENFKLIDHEDIYICDASIFNNYVSSNIHSSVIVLADLFSKKFIEKHCEFN
jgi:hypothetical protein